MNSIDILKKHIAKGEKLVLTNEDGTTDEILLKPLNMAEQEIAFKLAKSIGKQDGKNVDLSKVDDSCFNLMFDLLQSVLMRSVEGLEAETAEQFVVSNFNEFQEVLPKLMPTGKQAKRTSLMKTKLGVKKNE